MSSRKDQRVYDPEFKKEAVRLVIEKKRECADVASSLGIPKGTLYTWVHEFRQHQEVAFPGKGHLRPEDEELRRLHRRIADLEEENEILKKAAAIFAQLPRRNTK